MDFINYAAKGKIELAKMQNNKNISNDGPNVNIDNNENIDIPIITLDDILQKVEIEYVNAPRVAIINGVPRQEEILNYKAGKLVTKYGNFGEQYESENNDNQYVNNLNL